MKSVKFVILTTQRSGSTWIVDVLDKCANTAVYGELFLPTKMKWQAGSSDFLQFFEHRRGIRPLATINYLNAFYRQPGHTGFKLMYSNVRTYPEIVAYLCWRRLPVVHLVRQNVLDTVISSERGKANGQWHKTAVDTAVTTASVTQIELDPATLLQKLHWLQQKIAFNRRWLRICRLPHLEISYEALMQNANAFERITSFLGLPEPATNQSSTFSKIRRASYSDEIINIKEIKETLAGTEFETLLESGKNGRM